MAELVAGATSVFFNITGNDFPELHRRQWQSLSSPLLAMPLLCARSDVAAHTRKEGCFHRRSESSRGSSEVARKQNFERRSREKPAARTANRSNNSVFILRASRRIFPGHRPNGSLYAFLAGAITPSSIASPRPIRFAHLEKMAARFPVFSSGHVSQVTGLGMGRN